LRFGWQNDGRLANADLYRIDAKKQFGASVDACLLLVRCGEPGLTQAEVFDGLDAARPSSTFGLVGRELVADLPAYHRLRHLEGSSPYQWRSGLKHDCATVMELRRSGPQQFQNKLGEQVHLEDDYVFPLLKCSDLAHGRTEPSRFVVATQRRVGEDTAGIAKTAPRTWQYLESHRELFDSRKSSIYRGAPPFALFGVGDYAFALWKVAVSGLHRSPRFCVVGPAGGKPVLFDDTCYLLPFAEESRARVVAELLNSPPCLEFLQALTFPDAKRPITVDLLQRLNLGAVAAVAGSSGREDLSKLGLQAGGESAGVQRDAAEGKSASNLTATRRKRQSRSAGQHGRRHPHEVVRQHGETVEIRNANFSIERQH
jgi:hypothetical protein